MIYRLNTYEIRFLALIVLIHVWNVLKEVSIHFSISQSIIRLHVIRQHNQFQIDSIFLQ
ncbi:hypothetical protein D3C76_1654160 [compost metagenome]